MSLREIRLQKLVEMRKQGIQAIENPLQGSLLAEAHICVSVTVLYANYVVADNGYPRSIAKELLVSRLGIELFCLNVLVVEVKVIFFVCLQLFGPQKGMDEQSVHVFGDIEIIRLS
jgi:hypothetical protein